MNEFVESLFNLETDLLLKRCKDTDEGMIKREKGLWVAPELPIVPYCVFGKSYFVWWSEFSEGTSLIRDILFPESKTFAFSLLCPGVLPTGLEKLEGFGCLCF